MTGDRDAPDTDTLETGESATDGSETATAGTRRARIETTHGDTETARLLARTLRPDNTAEMGTRVEGCRLVTTIERETTGGLQSTADDYVVNLQTGTQVLSSEGSSDTTGRECNHNTDSDGDTTSRDTSDTDTPTETGDTDTPTETGDTDTPTETGDTDTHDTDTNDTTRPTETDNE